VAAVVVVYLAWDLAALAGIDTLDKISAFGGGGPSLASGDGWRGWHERGIPA
jgi:hypothetical protein